MKFITALFAFMLLMPGVASAHYIEGTIGYQASSDLDVGGWNLPFDNGYLVGFAVGTLLANSISAEAEFTYSERDAEDYPYSLSALAFMANTYYNFQVANAVAGYLGLGVGGIQLELDSSSNSESDIVFGYQFLVGLTYAVNNAILFAEYRYQASQDGDFNGVDAEYNSHTIGVGLRIPF